MMNNSEHKPRIGIIGWNVTIYNPDLDPDRNSALRIIDYLSAGSAQLIERKD